jgi:multidrug efflux pump subunit AcrA (membrane-fusion protein)
VVLADLEGKPRRQVAHELGVAEGTVASRQARARVLLAGRLGRRGWGLPAALAVATAGTFPDALTAGVVAAVGSPAPGPLALAERVVTTMANRKLFAGVLAALVVGLGVAGLTTAQGPGGPPRGDTPKGYTVVPAGDTAVLLDPATGETWVLTRPAGAEPTWVPVRRPERPTSAAKDVPPAPGPQPPQPAAGLYLAGRLTLTKTYRVHPRAAGTVADILVRVGEEVKAGQPLVRLDDTEARLAVEAAEAGLAVADADVPRGDGSAPASTIRRAEAQVRKARVDVSRAKAALDATVLRAPADGTVVELNVAAGDAVAPSGPPVAVVALLRLLTAVVDVPERDAGRATVGAECVVRVEAGGKEYRPRGRARSWWSDSRRRSRTGRQSPE